MDTQLEKDLRLALMALAGELPADASRRVLAHPYRPRGVLPRPALAAGCVTVAAAGAAAIVTVGLGTSAPRAFAGWSATPTPAAGSHTRIAEEACRSRLPTSSRIEQAQRSASGAHAPWPIPRISAGGWRTILVDVRGPYRAILFDAAQGRAELSCFSGRNPAEPSLGGGFATRPRAPVAHGHVQIVSSGSNTTPSDEGSRQFSSLVGRTGAGVTGVTLRLGDGARVSASTANGWFLAWWPGRHYVTALEITGRSGVRVQPFGDRSRQRR